MLADDSLRRSLRIDRGSTRDDHTDSLPKNMASRKYYHSGLALASAIFVFFIASVVLVMCLYMDAGSQIMIVVSGAVGVFGGGYVLIRYNSDITIRSPGMTILYYRTICDVLLGMDSLYARESLCALPAALLEFSMISSEAWFLCAAVDVAVAVTNPFSSFKTRLRYYHVFSWGVGFTMALILACVRGFSGLWYANGDHDEFAVCWVNVNNENINYRSWIMLYAPICLIYAYALYVLVCARKILRNGIPYTFLHRAQALYMNNVMLITFSVYNALLALLVLLTRSMTGDRHGQTIVWAALLNTVACKGYIGLFVFLLGYSSTQNSKGEGSSSVLFDLNSALQLEVVTYATAGIKHCAALQPATSSHIDRHHVVIKVPSNQFTLSMQAFNALANDFRKLKRALRESALVSNVASFKSSVLVTDDPPTPGLSRNASHMSQIDGTVISDCGRVSAIHVGNGDGSISVRAKNDRASSNPVLVQQSCGVLAEIERYSESKPSGDIDHGVIANREANMQSTSTLMDKIEWAMEASSQWLRKWSVVIVTGSDIEFTEYSPMEFQAVRRAFGLEHSYLRDDSSDNEIKTSIRSFEKQIQNRVTEGGASNALFFFSQCNRFVAKSCTAEEMKQVRAHITPLVAYFISNTDTFITKIFGAYKLKMYACDLYFIVTNNVLHTRPGEMVVEKYDLKGSSVYRNMSPPRNGERVRCKACSAMFTYNSKTHVDRDRERSNPQGPPLSPLSDTHTPTGHASARRRHSDPFSDDNFAGEDATICPLFRHEPDCILKDNDMRGRSRIRLHSPHADWVLTQLHKDCTFLSDVYKVMDYSLLLGVYKKVIVLNDQSEGNNDHVLGNGDESLSDDVSVIGNSRIQAGEFVVDYSYYLGIIDYQQSYTIRKKLENWAKVSLLGQPPDELSCVPPAKYRDRFLEFIEDLIL